MLAWAAYGAAVALYAVGHAMHRYFAPRRPGRRPANRLAFAVSRRRWSLRRRRLSLMRMKLDDVVGLRRMPRELQCGSGPAEEAPSRDSSEAAHR